MSRAVIRLSSQDNIGVCCRTVTAGETLMVDELLITVCETVSIGHKLALIALEPGDKVVKYGMPIGSITKPVRAGEWAHLHNMQSDYMPAHLRDASGGER